MIDTVRFRIPETDELLKSVRAECAVFEKKKQGNTLFKFVRESLFLGSYTRGVVITATDYDEIFIEFSAPKLYYGHNIYLLHPSSLGGVLAGLHSELEDLFHGFPHYMNWVLQRLDVCYAWQLQGEGAVDNAISLLKTFTFPRKEPYLRDGSIMFTGSAYSVKFYDKHKEFRAHDFKELGRTDSTYDLLEKSKGVLRFEATLRKKQVEFEFGKEPTYKTYTDEGIITGLLNKYLKKYLRNLNTKTMTESEIHDKLIARYGKTRGIQLFQFYVLYFSSKELHRKFLLQNYHRTQIGNNLRAIAKADVGLSNENLGFNFDFSIPSTDSVYMNTIVPAPAGA